jgi:uncharacterized membrane protein
MARGTTSSERALWLRRGLGLLVGGGIGLAFYALIGCRTGVCPLVSDPISATVLGAIVGLINTLDGKKQTS